MTLLSKPKVAIIGLGYVGLSLAASLSGKGARVFGIDRREEIVKSVNSGICPIKEPGMGDLVRGAAVSGSLSAHSGANLVREADVIILAVGTPLDQEYRPDLRQLTEAVGEISPFVRKGQTVILKSTVPPGTTREMARLLTENTGLDTGKDLYVAFCPERLAEGRILKDLETIPVVVGGMTPEDTEKAAFFWAAMGWEVIKVSGPEEAEMVKLADNLWIDLNISLANELCMMCHDLGVDVLEVINGANTLPKGMGKVNILFPGPGVGGSCLVKDPWFVHFMGIERGVPLQLPSTGRKINEGMPGFIVKIIEKQLSAKSGLKGAGICVLGLSFKQNTGDTRFSPSLPLVELLSAGGARVSIYDSWVPDRDCAALVGGLAKVETDLRSAVKDCQAVVFMVGHSDFPRDPNYWADILEKDCLVIDCRYIFDAAGMSGAGINYVAPGRRVLPLSGGERCLCREF